MVIDIAKAIGKIENVEVLVTDTRGERFEYEGVKFLKRSILLYLFSLFHTLPLGSLFRLMKNYSMTNGTAIRLAYYWVMTGHLHKMLKEEKYDVVHIHGCSFATELWIKVCKQNNQKYVITLHGLNSFSDTVKLESAGKQYERDFLKRVADGDYSITVISSGMKRIIENTYNKEKCPNIHVICNSFSFNKFEAQKVDLRKTYNLPDESKIIVCVGNIGRRKNQRQLITAFNLLPQELATQTYILFLGGNQSEDYTIEILSEDSPWASHFIACGLVPKEQVGGYYAQCDAVALMSLSEGFGLSLIEGMHFGKPSMSFTDIDAFEDIYTPIAMVGVEEQSDRAVAEGMERLLNTKWDERKIKEYSKKFESQSMTNKYVDMYKRVVTK